MCNLKAWYINKYVVGIPMGKNCAPLIAELFLYCYERDFILTFINLNSMTLCLTIHLNTLTICEFTIVNPETYTNGQKRGYRIVYHISL